MIVSPKMRQQLHLAKRKRIEQIRHRRAVKEILPVDRERYKLDFGFDKVFRKHDNLVDCHPDVDMLKFSLDPDVVSYPDHLENLKDVLSYAYSKDLDIGIL